ncbi:MAG TPA: MBL fold metallo-hydrolase [Candidatus Dormibacteraeota bacterium]
MAVTGGWEELAPGVYRLVSEPFDLNVGLVVGQMRALLVDTGVSLNAGQGLVKLAQSTSDLPLGAVNTHHHFDHCFGNGALAPEVIWSHRLCAEHLRWDGLEQQREVITAVREAHQVVAQQIAVSPIVVPGCLLENSTDLDLGGRTVSLIHPGRGHTDNDVAVWVPDVRVLFTGDLVEEGNPPSFEDGYPLEWPGSLEGLVALAPDAVVPGHGAVVDMAFIRQQQTELQELADVARKGFAGARRPSELDAETPFPGKPARTAIRRAYVQIAAESTGGWLERQPG